MSQKIQFGELYSGFWTFIDSDGETRAMNIPGVLKIDSQVEIELSTIERYQLIPRGRSRAKSETIITGVGKSTSQNRDEEFTLLGCTLKRHSISSLERIVFSVRQIFVGEIIKSIVQDKFAEAIITLDSLESWVGASGINSAIPRITQVNDNIYDGQFRYNHPQPIQIFNDKKISVYLEYEILGPNIEINKRITIEEYCFIRVRFKRRLSVYHVNKVIDQLFKFFVFTIGYPVQKNRVAVRKYTTLGAKRLEITSNRFINFYESSTRNIMAKKIVKSQDMILTYVNNRELVESAIHNWLTKYNLYQLVIDYCLEQYFNPRKTIENRFLEVVSAIEMLHRITDRGIEFKDPKYHRRVERILSRHLQNDREWLRKRLQYKSEDTLRSRLRDIMTKLKRLSSDLSISHESQINKIVCTRNFLIHFTVSEKDRAAVLQPNSLVAMTKRLNIILQAMLINCLIDCNEVSQQLLSKLTRVKILERKRPL